MVTKGKYSHIVQDKKKIHSFDNWKKAQKDKESKNKEKKDWVPLKFVNENGWDIITKAITQPKCDEAKDWNLALSNYVDGFTAQKQ